MTRSSKGDLANSCQGQYVHALILLRTTFLFAMKISEANSGFQDYNFIFQ